MRQQRASAANETSAMKIRKYITIKQEFDEIRPYKKSKELNQNATKYPKNKQVQRIASYVTLTLQAPPGKKPKTT